jgi:hypothetical protein
VIGPLLDELPANHAVFDPLDGRPQDHYIFLGLSLDLTPIGLVPGEDLAQSLRSGFDLDRRFNLPLLSMLNVKYLLARHPLRGEGVRLVHAPTEAPQTLSNLNYATGLRNSDIVSPWADLPYSDWPSRVLSDGVQALERKRRGKDVYIYENTSVLPRFRFVTRVEALDGPRAVLDRLTSLRADELAERAIVDLNDGAPARTLGARDSFAQGEITVTCYSPDEIVLKTNTAGEGFLVLSMTWNPGWQASFDNVRATPIRTNHAQIGLPTPQGEHVLRLRYAPRYGGPLRYTAHLSSRRCR